MKLEFSKLQSRISQIESEESEFDESDEQPSLVNQFKNDIVHIIDSGLKKFPGLQADQRDVYDSELFMS